VPWFNLSNQGGVHGGAAADVDVVAGGGGSGGCAVVELLVGVLVVVSVVLLFVVMVQVLWRYISIVQVQVKVQVRVLRASVPGVVLVCVGMLVMVVELAVVELAATTRICLLRSIYSSSLSAWLNAAQNQLLSAVKAAVPALAGITAHLSCTCRAVKEQLMEIDVRLVAYITADIVVAILVHNGQPVACNRLSKALAALRYICCVEVTCERSHNWFNDIC
jgi:hypothetical protein